MSNSRIRLFCCSLLVFVLLAGFAATAFAAPSLTWHTDRVYYDNVGRLIIEGYFYNNGTRTITGINWVDTQVYFRQHGTNWWLQAAATFRDINIYLNPGDAIRWTFRIHNVDYAYFDYWNVRWTANYQFQ